MTLTHDVSAAVALQLSVNTKWPLLATATRNWRVFTGTAVPDPGIRLHQPGCPPKNGSVIGDRDRIASSYLERGS